MKLELSIDHASKLHIHSYKKNQLSECKTHVCGMDIATCCGMTCCIANCLIGIPYVNYSSIGIGCLSFLIYDCIFSSFTPIQERTAVVAILDMEPTTQEIHRN